MARLKRAALYALGGTLTVACAETSAVPLYGAPAIDASVDAADSGMLGAMYGGPCPGGGCWEDAAPGDAAPDAGVADAATADAMSDACVHRVYALYGGPALCLDEDDAGD